MSRLLGMSAMTGVLLLAFAIGAKGLHAWPIRTDELFSVSNMGGFDPPFSPSQIVESVITYSPDHVPLFFLLGAGWASLVGWSDFALRSFSLLTAILLIAWLYRLGARVFDRPAGLIAAFLMGTSAYLVLHFHDFRMYPLLLLLAVVHTWLYWNLCRGGPQVPVTWILLLATAVALVYTHSTALILFAGLAIYHLLVLRKSRLWFGITLAWAVAALTYLPYLPTLLAGVGEAATSLNQESVAATAGELIVAFLRLLSNGAPWLLLLLAVLATYSLLRRRDRAAAEFLVLPLGMLAAFVALNELIGFIPLSRMRYFLIIWFPFLLLLARALSQMPRWVGLTIACIFLWCAAGVHYYGSRDVLEFVGGIAKTRDYPALQDYVAPLRDQVRPEDFLLGFTWDDYVNFDHKHGKSAADFYTQLHLGIDGAFVRSRAIGAWLVGEMDKLIDGHPYLLFAYEPSNEPEGLEGAIYHMQSNYRACHVLVDTQKLFVQRYVHPAFACDRSPMPIAYENGIKVLDRFAVYKPDEHMLRILIGWRVSAERLLRDYNISLQILTPDWDNVRQIDYHLYDDLLPWSELELSTVDLPAGEYRLVLILYHNMNAEKVEGQDLSTGETATILPVLSFAVE